MNEDFVLLLDIYGDLLPQSQREALDLRHNSDLTLAEIAEEKGGISRQSIHDACRKGESRLLELESVLGNAKRLKTLSGMLDKAENIVKELKNAPEELLRLLEDMRKEL